MSTPETPRIWTLEGDEDDVIVTGALLDDGEEYVVVEKAPVDAERERLLDLLENQGDFLDTVTQWTGSDPDELHEYREAIDAVLREYGRLGDTTAEALNRRYGLPKEES